MTNKGLMGIGMLENNKHMRVVKIVFFRIVKRSDLEIKVPLLKNVYVMNAPKRIKKEITLKKKNQILFSRKKKLYT